MTKNNLIICSLLMLPLSAALPLHSSQPPKKPTPAEKKAYREQQTKAYREQQKTPTKKTTNQPLETPQVDDHMPPAIEENNNAIVQANQLIEDPIPAQQCTPCNLEDSVMITPVTETRGFGIFRSLKDLAWNEEENLFADLLNRSFDPNNSSYHRKLDTAIETYVTKKNNTRLTEIFAICRQAYRKQIKTGDSPSRMAHDFLVQENKAKQLALKETIEAKDRLFIDHYNKLLVALKHSINEQINAISTHLSSHTAHRETIVQEYGQEIRRLKTGLVNLHHLNKTFVLPKEGYCSDNETNADNVMNSYNDIHLLEKIKVDQSMRETKTKAEGTLEALNSTNKSLQCVQLLHY